MIRIVVKESTFSQESIHLNGVLESNIRLSADDILFPRQVNSL